MSYYAFMLCNALRKKTMHCEYYKERLINVVGDTKFQQ